MPDASEISVPKNILDAAMEECREFVRRRDNRFVEMGGALIGRFDGDWHVDELVRDHDADATVATIRFSSGFFESIQRNPDQELLGTWHVHPPGHGTQFSSTDLNHLFLERMMLTTDRPIARFPRCHMILDLNEMPASAYTFAVDVQYAFHRVTDIGQFAELISSIRKQSRHDPLGTLWFDLPSSFGLGTYTAIDSSAPELRVAPQMGFWKTFPLSESVPESLRKIACENFFAKFHRPEFIVAEVNKNEDVTLLLARRQSTRQVAPFRDIRYVQVPLRVIDPVAAEPPGDESELEVAIFDPDVGSRLLTRVPVNAKIHDLISVVAQRIEGDERDVILYVVPNRTIDPIAYPGLVFDRAPPRVFLPHDWSVARAIDELCDPDLRYFYLVNRGQSPDTVFRLRTARMRSCGYDPVKLQSRRVLIGGLGILGGEVSMGLATAGIGAMDLVDCDRVDWVNIYRQPLYERDDVLKPKALAAESSLKRFDGLTVRGHQFFVPSLHGPDGKSPHIEEFLACWTKLGALVEGADLVIGAFDRASTRMALQAQCLARGIAFMSLAVGGIMGNVMLNTGRTAACYCCGLAPDPLNDRGTCTVATLDSQKIVSAIAIRHALELLHGAEPQQNFVELDGRDLAIRSHRLSPAPRCFLCRRGGLLDAAVENHLELGRRLFALFDGGTRSTPSSGVIDANRGDDPR